MMNENSQSPSESRAPDLSQAGPFRLGEWHVAPDLNRIYRGSDEVQLEPKAMAVLLCLAQGEGRVVRRSELFERVWENRYVTDYVLSRCISALRKAFGDDANAPTYIETVRKGGYRLLIQPQWMVEPLGQPPGVQAENALNASLPRSWRFGWWLAGIALVVLGTVLFFPGRSEPSVRWRETQLTTLLGNEVDPALSSDGRRLVFAWDGEGEDNFNLYQKWLDSNEIRQLTHQPGEEKNPAWSPDDQWIAYVYAGMEDQGIYKVSSLGGDPQKVTTTVSGNIPDLTWSPDGKCFYFTDKAGDNGPFSIFRFNLETGEKTRITHPPDHFYGDRDLALSPDGQFLLLARAVANGMETLWRHDLGTGESKCLDQTVRGILGIACLPDQRGAVFAAEGAHGSGLWYVDLKTGQVTPWEGYGENGNDPTVDGLARRLVYERKNYQANIWSLTKVEEAWKRLERIASSTFWESIADISPDGTQITFVSNRLGRHGIWVASLQNTDSPRHILDYQGGEGTPPIFTPDGGSLIYGDSFRGQLALLKVNIASGVSQPFLQDKGRKMATTWSRSGNHFYFSSDRSGEWQIWRLTPSTGKLTQVTENGGIHARESEDGRWLYFSKPSQSGLWRQPLEGGDAEWVLEDLSAGYRRDWDLYAEGVVYLPETRFANQRKSFYFHHLRTGATYQLTEPLPWLSFGSMGVVVAPDQQTIYFSRLDRLDSDLWLLESEKPKAIGIEKLLSER